MDDNSRKEFSKELARTLRSFSHTRSPGIDFEAGSVIESLGNAEKFVGAGPLIREWQSKCTDLLKDFLSDPEEHPDLRFLLAEQSSSQGIELHTKIVDSLAEPAFFRTDCAADGKVLEVQCPGSLWGEYELIRETHKKVSNDLKNVPELKSRVADGLLSMCQDDRVLVHHFVENASRPIHQTIFNYMVMDFDSRIRYVGLDPYVNPADANVIRTHLFSSLLAENFTEIRIRKFTEGLVAYDYPLNAIFELKFLLSLVFHPRYSAHFDGRIRSLFPYTAQVKPSEVRLGPDQSVTIDQFIQMPRKQRRYYIKYAGSRPSYNWGSRAVYYTGMQSQTSLKKIFEGIVSDYRAGSPWIIQEAVESKSASGWYEKVSGFYTPQGLAGILTMKRKFPKVHGSNETLLSVARVPSI